MATNNSSAPESKLNAETKAGMMGDGFGVAPSQSAPPVSAKKPGCLKVCLVVIITIIIVVLTVAIYIYSYQPQEITDSEEASKILGQMLKKVQPGFSELPGQDYPAQISTNIIAGKIYFWQNSGPYHISVVIPALPEGGSKAFPPFGDYVGVNIGTYVIDDEGKKQAYRFYAVMLAKIYDKYAKLSNVVPDEWKCTKMIVKPVWVADVKLNDVIGSVVFIVDEDSRFEPLDICGPLIKELAELDKLRRLGLQ